MPIVKDLLLAARKRLSAAPFHPPGREAALLLGHVLGLGEAQLYARSEDPVPPLEEREFEALLSRRLRGEPVAHLVGEREFYGRPFAVDSRVLIPRPETEHLIETVLGLDLPAEPRILDLGTGSGCIALTLALEIPTARVIATDLSLAALQVFLTNRQRLGSAARDPSSGTLIRRALPLRADLAEAVDLDRFDLLLSNPPYVEPGIAADLSTEVRDFEPHMALFPPGKDGRAILRRLLPYCLRLRPGTHALFEIGYDQSEWLRGEIAELPGLDLLRMVRDLSGIERIALLRRI